ncbi:MAG TPA: dehydrogenase [Bacteroidales bacterium]|jgi:D-glycero-alpha-D-manno-heptose-7-phosphate kinase|nr:dehydrogenase [Bacteroidales bacterium]
MAVIRSKAPLRVSLAGGGSDVSPFSEMFGGAILNATINLYAHASIEPADDGMITIVLADRKIETTFDAAAVLPVDSEMVLHAGVYNRLVKDFFHRPLSFRMITSVDAPPGSGLGTSSTLVVAILGAFAEWQKLPLGEYDIAHLAYDIERQDLGLAGGKQDQYSATFGGVNFMEFSQDDKVIVNPLRIRQIYLDELSHNLVLYYTATSRSSAGIIEAQQRNVLDGNKISIDAMHQMKKQAVMMKEALLRGNLCETGEILDYGWHHKKLMADEITNPLLEQIYTTAMKNGATGGKISGAGGGGFMLFYCPGNTRYAVIESLKQFGGEARRFEFTTSGLRTWSI